MLADFPDFLRPGFLTKIPHSAVKQSSISRPLRRAVIYWDAPPIPRRVVNRIQNNHIAQSLHAIAFHRLVRTNRLGKRIQFRRKFVTNRKRPPDPTFLPDLHREPPLFTKIVRGRQRSPTIRALNKHKRRQRRPIRRTTLRNQAARKPQSKRNTLLHIAKRGRIARPSLRAHFNRIFVHQPARSIHAVDPQIHQRSAARQLRIQQPSQRSTRREKFAERSMNHVNSPQLAALNQFLQVNTAGLKKFPVSGHQQHAPAPASLHHLRSLRHISRQRLFAQNMLSRRSRLHCIGRMRSGWSGNINSRNFRTGQTCREFVGSVISRSSKFPRYSSSLVAIAAHHSNQLRVLRARKRRQHRSARNRPQPHYRKADLFLPPHELSFRGPRAQASDCGSPCDPTHAILRRKPKLSRWHRQCCPHQR